MVSKAVGGAVTRSRVKRRLRHQAVPLVDSLPAGTAVVLRALPAAAAAGSAELGEELRAGVDRCLQRTPEMSR